MMFAKPDDILRCRLIVQDILKNDCVTLEDEKVNEIVQKVLDITYATGGDYSNKTLAAYASVHIRANLNTYK